MSSVRRFSRQVKVGGVKIGGGAPVSVQSMTTTKTEDVQSTIAQIKELEAVGCELVRMAVPNTRAVAALGDIKKKICIPLIADIHFDYRLALAALEAGVDKIRINPGNIGDQNRVKMIVEKAREKRIPIRIGVNAGSLHKKYAEVREGQAKALVDSALEYIKFCEDLNFRDIVVSVKASSVPVTIDAYKMLATKVDYPLHLGITEAGTLLVGAVKSAIGLGVLLNEGIGDTIRVSLTADPVEEVRVSFEILKALGLRRGPELISCPTCGRCEVDLISLAEKVERRISHCRAPIKIAVMGCVVNGPGEAREADVGIAAGRGAGLLFAKGEVVRKVPEGDLIDALMEEIRKYEEEIPTRGEEGS
ncbi:MAG TPA: 4-hydroxy-3-methylbut-2-en-1-yl diphosphate synthase [Actinobacteria bacterium]|nr:4-hydroxy-3-methylbut-2-en-1-yl diphosphate synthase [Actinomycetota bacterium]